jgi:hypothetical protein
MFGLDSKLVEEEDMYCEEGDQMGNPVAEIQAGPLNLKIFEGSIIDYDGELTKEFIVKGWREQFRILVWKDCGDPIVQVCDFDNSMRTEPREIDCDGTYIDLVNLPAVKYEVFGWIICRDPMVIDYIRKYDVIKDALEAIRLILENRNRAYNVEIMKKIYPVFAMGITQFRLGGFRDLVEKEVSDDAALLLPILSRIFVAVDAIRCGDITADDLVAAISMSGMGRRLWRGA